MLRARKYNHNIIENTINYIFAIMLHDDIARMSSDFWKIAKISKSCFLTSCIDF